MTDKFELGLMAELCRDDGDRLVHEMNQRGLTHALRLESLERELTIALQTVRAEKQRFSVYMQEEKQPGRRSIQGVPQGTQQIGAENQAKVQAQAGGSR